MADVNAAGDRELAVASESGPGASVIIIFLNPLPWLNEAVDSVFRQTFTDWELLLVDDGSTDGGAEVAQQIAAARPDRVRYLAHPGRANLGMSASRNLGLQHARGRHVAFLDADDVYLPERLARHVHILDAMPSVDMVQSDLIFWHSWQSASQRPSEDYVRPFLSVGDRVLPPPLGMLVVLAEPWLGAGICNITVRRSVALELGGFEPRFRALFEDQVFTSKVYLEKVVYVLHDYLVMYRRHSESCTRRMKGTNDLAAREFHSWLKQYVAQRRGARHALLEEALESLDAVPARSASWATRTVRASVQLLLRLLPASLHRRLMRLVMLREAERARRRYGELCRRLDRAAISARLGGEHW